MSEESMISNESGPTRSYQASKTSGVMTIPHTLCPLEALVLANIGPSGSLSKI